MRSEILDCIIFLLPAESRGEDIAKLCPEDGGGCHFVPIGEVRK